MGTVVCFLLKSLASRRSEEKTLACKDKRHLATSVLSVDFFFFLVRKAFTKEGSLEIN